MHELSVAAAITDERGVTTIVLTAPLATGDTVGGHAGAERGCSPGHGKAGARRQDVERAEHTSEHSIGSAPIERDEQHNRLTKR